MIIFTLEDIPNLKIIPVQLNIMFNNILANKEEGKIAVPVPDLFAEVWGKIIRKCILDDIDITYIIDMDGIKGSEKTFEYLAEIKNVNLIYINCHYLIPKYLHAAYKEKIYQLEKENETFAVLEGKQYIDRKFKNYNKFYQRINTYYKEACSKRLKEDGISNTITLNSSSNIYATAYVDVKRLLSKKDNISIFLYGLYKILLQLDNFDSFVVVSNNGAVLANILADILKKPVLYLLNLGPKIAINDNEIKSKIEKGNRYVYIYDFLCLGNEYKLLNMLLKINDAKLVKGIGIAQLLPSNRYGTEKEAPESIICLRDYPSIFSYKISCYEEEL